MGSLVGHVLPGALFLLFGVWWVFMSVWTHLTRSWSSSRSKGAKGKPKRETSGTSYSLYKQDHDLSRKSWLPQPFCSRIPLEPVIKILLPFIGVIAEAFFDEVPDHNGDQHLVVRVYRLYDDDGNFTNLGKLHHITMYSVFILSGIIDLVSIFIKFPRHTNQVFFSLAFCVEGILFYFHTDSSMRLAAQVHGVLTVSVFACGLFAFLRIFQAANLLINVGLSSAIVFQATWFIQAGYILYGKGWHWSSSEDDKDVVGGNHGDEGMDTAEHRLRMFVAACVTWHLMSIALFNLLVWVVLHVVLRSGIRSGLGRKRGARIRGQPSNWLDREEQRSLITAEAVPPSPVKENEVEVEMQEVGVTET